MEREIERGSERDEREGEKEKEQFLNADTSLPSSIVSLLQDVDDEPSKKLPSESASIRRVEQQIDFESKTSTSNPLADQSNSNEVKKIQRQDMELMKRGHLRENTSPFVVPRSLVPKVDENWRMCVDCQTINCKTGFSIVAILSAAVIEKRGHMRLVLDPG